MQGTTKDIECCIHSQYNSLVAVNRQIVVGVVDTIIICGQQILAIRGKGEDSRNFKALLDSQDKHNLVLKEKEVATLEQNIRLQKRQNELISICRKLVSNKIVQACNYAEMFGFIADEASDSPKNARQS
ncbi:hypothetical protein DPMN_069594 [Dreissena polymorpha]|uniref:DUF4371 domain-containing protein n=1 Tax=Dreissena polymorpha TaxID=45954 RepID=A0A9D3Z3K2_DREPO|nr:hypothetical protein DPMN_069594 [Dreissena polymorpha]